jgi:hypothetical protein
MAYQINLTNGTTFATIADGTINTQTNLTLVGKNYPGYGEFIDENFIHLLENAANNAAPASPLTGQLWFNTTTKVLQVWQGVAWKSLGGATASATPPSNSQTGDLWYDTVNQQLKVYDATKTPDPWILVGPQFSGGTGVTGAIPVIITDQDGNNHTIIQLTVANAVVACVSKDATFVPSGAGISGFANVRPGITLASSVSGVVPQFFGTANNASSLQGFTASNFVQNSGNAQTMATSLAIQSDTGLSVGVDNDLRVSVSGTTVTLANQNQDGNVLFRVNKAGVATTVLTLDGANASVVFANLSVPEINKTGSNAVGNIGSSTNYFNRVFATATTALYADVAERFAADDVYAPGTVVELGGVAEITRVQDDLSDNVFGVISSKPAFTMNGGAGDDDTHPAVAMTGRVPVNVIGKVRKGDRLVSAGNGLARAALKGEATSFNVIGRSLVDKNDTGEGVVEAIVTIQ